MPLSEELLEPWFFHRWPVKRIHELPPLFFIQDETGLVCEGFFRPLAGRAENELGDVEALAFGGDFDEGLFAGGGAELKAPVLRLFRC